MDLSFLGLLPRKLTYCLQINGWEMKDPFETVPFLADMLFFFRGMESRISYQISQHQLFNSRIKPTSPTIPTIRTVPISYPLPPARQFAHLSWCIYEELSKLELYLIDIFPFCHQKPPKREGDFARESRQSLIFYRKRGNNLIAPKRSYSKL